jgi:alpha,alpha-trehalose phosphorylase
MAAEVGHLQLAYDYLAEAALTDLHDLHANVENGLHIASLAGTWTACVAGFGGMRDHDGDVTFAPRIPPQLTRLSFRMTVRGSAIHVDVRPLVATYRLISGEPLQLAHHGSTFTLDTSPVTKPIPAAPSSPAVRQPYGRAPVHRG